MIRLPTHRALAILDECTGDHLWSPEHCVRRGVPQSWIDQLTDNFESGFRSDSQTIYTDQGVTNQYRGIRDFDLAVRIARQFGIDVESILNTQLSRAAVVTVIKQAVSDDE